LLLLLFVFFLLYLGMENTNLIKISDNKIILKYPKETLIFEQLKNPNYEVGTQFLNYHGHKFFLTKIKS